MSKSHEVREKNELIKRKYLRWYRGAEGMSELTVRIFEKSIAKYEDCTRFEDFANFNSNRADIFKKYLATNLNKTSGRPLNLQSQYTTLRQVRNFFSWLASQPGYKSKIQLTEVQYLQLSKNDRRQALAVKEPNYPTIEQVRKLCSFPVNNEIDQRDRALIAFTALTGMRDKAIITLRFGCYDPIERLVKQSPSMGVETKFRKEIFTTLLGIDDKLFGYFNEWYEHIRVDRQFGIHDPLFPSTEVSQVGPSQRTFTAKGVSKEFWANACAMRAIFKDRATQTGVPYFYPHSFRHFITNLAEHYISTPEQMKALSQNLGHEHVTTTFRSYGTIDRQRVGEIIKGISFESSPSKIDPKDIEHIVAEVLKSRGV